MINYLDFIFLGIWIFFCLFMILGSYLANKCEKKKDNTVKLDEIV